MGSFYPLAAPFSLIVESDALLNWIELCGVNTPRLVSRGGKREDEEQELFFEQF